MGMRSLRGLGLSVVIALATAATSPAGASCGRGPDVEVVPYGDGVAPMNAHVRVTLHAEWRAHGLGCNAIDRERYNECAAGDYALVLRTAPLAGVRPEDVATKQREARSAEIATVELVPETPLRARTRYEVWYVEARGLAMPRILATFSTGAGTDTTAPSWAGIKRAKRPAQPHMQGRVFVIREPCDADGIDVEIAQASDDLTPTAQLRYAVWIEDAKGGLDYASPPLVYEAAYPFDTAPRAKSFTLSLGTNETRRNFDLPQNKNRTLKIGVRAVDLAGNASAPSEATVTL